MKRQASCSYKGPNNEVYKVAVEHKVKLTIAATSKKPKARTTKKVPIKGKSQQRRRASKPKASTRGVSATTRRQSRGKSNTKVSSKCQCNKSGKAVVKIPKKPTNLMPGLFMKSTVKKKTSAQAWMAFQ